MDGLSFMEINNMTESEARSLIEKLRPDSKQPVRDGVYKCSSCRKQFTVTVGTIFEGTRIPLKKWLLAIHMMCASKEGISAHQLHRNLDITYKSAWFMAHRIRWAMTQPPLSGKLKGTVEIDETYVGGKSRKGGPPQVGPGRQESAGCFAGGA